MIAGITRVRDESLIIADTIEHFLQWCDHVVLYDDCSTDDTVALARAAGGDQITIIHGDEWKQDRQWENTRHRKIAFDAAVKMGADWILCFDADERLVGEFPKLTDFIDGYQFRLFDGYLTATFQLKYAAGALEELPRMWGPEYRDILMLFRADCAKWDRTGLREPVFSGFKKRAPVFVKHFGKCLSVEHWDETCRYYMAGFPRSFYQRWAKRVGKAIHTKSDFDRPLLTWDELLERPETWVEL